VRGVNEQGESDPIKDMVLLSDGLENTAPFVEDVLPGIINDNMVVYSVGLGSDADQELLKSVADRTGGVYRFAPSAQELWQIYNSILVKVYGESVVRTASGTVAQGGVAEESVLVDSSIGSATFAVFWPGSDLDLVLVQPDGSLIDSVVAHADPNITFVSGATYEFYKVDAPQYGEWKLRILGVSTPSGGEQYSISVTATDAMIFTAAPDKVEYFTGAPIKITASIEDSYLDVITPQYILGVSMQVTAEDPAGNTYFFDLYDDGLHGDSEANDGIYANAFGDTFLVGSYNFNIKVSGVNNRHGQPFAREYAFSTVVGERLKVDIDIKPGSDPNSINCNNEKNVITVAILTTEEFDATTVDHTTVSFEGATETHVDKKSGEPRRHEEDVDYDGDIDLVFHFRLVDTDLACDFQEGTLTGETFDGQAIAGTDAVRMIDPGGGQP
jgi:hypothetical protein